jgi:EAL domain-containing protein (putative c-di-GMP-specific phosphodiesterase class I)
MIAVDDTAAGYASLTHPSGVGTPVREARPRSSRGSGSRSHRAAAVAIGAFASQLDACPVAERVENEAELERLTELDVPLV